MMKNEYENTLRPAKNQVASPQLLPARWTNERFHFAAHFCVGHPMLLCTDSFYLLISRSSEKNKLIIHSLCMLFAVIGGRRERHKVTLPLSLGLIMIDCIALTLAYFHFRTFMRPGSDSARIWKKVKLSMRMKINFSRWVDFIFFRVAKRFIAQQLSQAGFIASRHLFNLFCFIMSSHTQMTLRHTICQNILARARAFSM